MAGNGRDHGGGLDAAAAEFGGARVTGLIYPPGSIRKATR